METIPEFGMVPGLPTPPNYPLVEPKYPLSRTIHYGPYLRASGCIGLVPQDPGKFVAELPRPSSVAAQLANEAAPLPFDVCSLLLRG